MSKSDQRTRVLLVIAHLTQGGAERFAYEVLKALDRSRFDVHLLTKRRRRKRDYYDDKIQALGIPIHRGLPIFLHYARRIAPRLMRMRLLRRIVELLHRLVARITIGDLLDDFDVIEIVQMEYYYLIEPLVEDNDRLLVHIMAAGFQYKEGQDPYSECRPGRKYRFAVFDPTFVNDFSHAPCRDAEVFDFPLAMDMSHTSDLSDLAVIERPYKVGMFVRISPERPVDGILRAFAKVAESVDAQLIWYGHGSPAPFEPLMEELGIRDRVIFPGRAATIERGLREGGLSFVYTTGSGSKIGYAGVEVASYGFPMLVWNQSDTPHEDVLAATGGAIHAHHDPAQLAEETLQLLKNPEEFRGIGRAIREYTLVMYDVRRHIGRLEQKFEDIAAERKAARLRGTRKRS